MKKLGPQVLMFSAGFNLAGTLAAAHGGHAWTAALLAAATVLGVVAASLGWRQA